MGKVSLARGKWNKDHSAHQEDEEIDKDSVDEENVKMEKEIAEGIRDEVEWLANLLDQCKETVFLQIIMHVCKTVVCNN